MEQDSQTSPEGANHGFEAYPYPGKGFKIGEYTIVDSFGHGSMATVFQAQDAGGHEVALKVFLERPGMSQTMLERFRREAEASKKLRRHPHIITVYAADRQGPYHYIAMESVKGSRTLEQMLESTPVGIPDIIRITAKIARALQYAHARHVVHRDVKPTNILIDEFGEPLLTDFGVAALFDWPSCTVTGALTGTPLYMSPEQARAEKVGPASDIYSLGVVLYEALTGVLPYAQGRSSPVQTVLEAVKNEPPRRPRLFRKEISPDLEAVVLKALEKTPEERYPDAQAFASDLENVLKNRPVRARHFGPGARLRYLLLRNRTMAIALGVSCATALLLLFPLRERVLQARFDALVPLAQLRSAEWALADAPARQEAGASRAWHEIRQARKRMASGDWGAASQSFQAAVNFSSETGDLRTTAIARLDQARCETLLGHGELALDLYRWIIKNRDTSDAIAGVAQLEYLIVSSLAGKDIKATEALSWREPPEQGPLHEAMRCLEGKVPVDDFYRRTREMPESFRNDGLLVAALRYHLEGKTKKANKALRACLRYSRPPSDWPAPLARELRSRFSR